MMTTSPSACIELKPGTHFAKCVLMPGDPLRAKYIAEHYLENPVLVNDVRNMLAYTGTYQGKEVSVMGSGMGIPSLGLYATELYEFFGVDSIIRVGSAGGLGDDVHVRDVVIAIGASSNTGFQDAVDLPGFLAPTADYGMLSDAVEAAKELGVRADVGRVYTSDFFYYPNPEAEINRKARATGHLALEMETAGLYLQAAVHGKKALSILTISDHIFTGEALSAAERQDSFHEMMEIALKTAAKAVG
ncbi:MAG: purine-nucleoside phosphorylase [Clostridiales bacterium]|jgi:purine-nucleoside phosphorylase|nr:purine-nucleoside phosphorylase [Chordicoccus furentiruminis]MCI6173267.1 purine-nucleoside phosphorylase [Clostridiales bacterium]